MLPEFCQAATEHISGTRDNQIVAQSEIDETSGQQDLLRRNTESAISDPLTSSHRKVKTPTIIVKTISEVDILDDGYRWRKYGQKDIKGHSYPRSYFKCTTPGCSIQKCIQRYSKDPKEVITIYKGGRHNHDVPATKTNNHYISNNNALQFKSQNINFEKPSFGNNAIAATMINPTACGTSVTEGTNPPPLSTTAYGVFAGQRSDQSGPDPTTSSYMNVTLPIIIVQTTSEVDLLDDGYRWWKYGQEHIKGHSFPRNYYKCATPGCNIRKHVERSWKDPKDVITTYKGGRHNHDVPIPKTNNYLMH